MSDIYSYIPEQYKAFHPYITYEEYKERFKDYFSVERDEKGVIEVKMHNLEGGPAVWGLACNMGWGPLIKLIGADPENEIFILGGTGEYWAAGADNAYIDFVFESRKTNPNVHSRLTFDTYFRVTDMIKSVVYDVDIPTIGVINGPSDAAHIELALLCDITLCAPNVDFFIPHYDTLKGLPGDGLFFIMREKLGFSRANYLALTGQHFTAEQAKEWGLIHEIVPTEDIYVRAHEIADYMMDRSRSVRRLTHHVMTRPLRSAVDEENVACGFQFWASNVND